MKLSIKEKEIGTIPVIEVVEKDSLDSLLPLIIYYHGWQINSRLVTTQGRKLAQQGFRVVLPDAQSHGRRYQEVSKIPSLTFLNSIYTNLFEFSYIINHYQQANLVDDRIGVGGLSMGGMTACALLTHNPQIKAAACLMGTPKLRDYRNRIEKSIKKAGYFLPHDYLCLTSWVQDYDLSLHPEKLGPRPLMIWHGSQDELVPFHLTHEFILENPQLNIEAHLDGSRHLVNSEIMDLTTDFFVRNLI